jgi:hypothetical protein
MTPAVRALEAAGVEFTLHESECGHMGGDPGREGIGRETRGFPPDY